MCRAMMCLAAGLLCSLPLHAEEKPKDARGGTEMPKKKFVGRPGELTEEEEARIDKIVDDFILFDIGLSKDKKALVELNKLGPEGIPSIIRGINKSAINGHSCPVTVLGTKLSVLIGQCEDPRVLQFIRDEVGAGVRKGTPYDSVLNNLRLKTVYRKREVDRLAADQKKNPPHTPGEKPGTSILDELDKEQKKKDQPPKKDPPPE